MKAHDYVRYESMRNTGITRSLAIPNPFSYVRLCEFLSQHWDVNLKPYFQLKTETQFFCYSQIHLQKGNADGALFHMNLPYEMKDSDLGTICQSLSINKRYKVTTDISRCFPSIYSHAITWALVGKDVAKATKRDRKLWYNQLDDVNVNLKYGETDGQLIGPHSSNLLSEVVLTAVDKLMEDAGFEYVRHIDDCEYYASTYEEAESFIHTFAKALKNFDLQINEKKTKIESLPDRSEDWVTQMNCFYVGAEKTHSGQVVFAKARLMAFIDLSKRLVLETGNLAVYLYMMKMVADKYLGAKAKALYINVVHDLLIKYPYLASNIDVYFFEKFDVPVDRIQLIAQNLYDDGIYRSNNEACSYALYWALKYNVTLDLPNLISDADQSEDCVFRLLGYLNAKRCGDKVQINAFEEMAKKIVDVDRFWYFVYEVLPATDLPTSDMKTIKNAKVTFLRDEFIYHK